VSTTTQRRYPRTMICAVWRVARSSVYAQRSLLPPASTPVPRKRGPHTRLSDDALVVEIKAVQRGSGFLTEGHRKVRARLQQRGIRVGKERVRRLMGQHRLLAPTRKCGGLQPPL
jgi:putative transposase